MSTPQVGPPPLTPQAGQAIGAHQSTTNSTQCSTPYASESATSGKRSTPQGHSQPLHSQLHSKGRTGQTSVTNQPNSKSAPVQDPQEPLGTCHILHDRGFPTSRTKKIATWAATCLNLTALHCQHTRLILWLDQDRDYMHVFGLQHLTDIVGSSRKILS